MKILQNLFALLGRSELLKSKKVRLAFLTALSAGVAKYLDADPEVVFAVVGAGFSAVLGQGLADFGKHAKPEITQQALLGLPEDILINVGVQAFLSKLNPANAARFRSVALKVFRQLRMLYAADPDFN